jgi:hypothetical protein
MNFAQRFSSTLVVLACVGLVLPLPQLVAAEQVRTSMVDLQLQDGGVLAGQLVDADGQALPGQEIVLLRGSQIVAQTTADAEGHFAFERVAGGVYQIAGGGMAVSCRCWAAHTAPPAASPRLLMVCSEQDLIRAQRPFSDIVTNPLVVGAFIAGAIAIPIAIHNSSDAS